MLDKIQSSAAWTALLLPVGLYGVIGACKLLIWVFAVGDFITGWGPAPWPF